MCSNEENINRKRGRGDENSDDAGTVDEPCWGIDPHTSVLLGEGGGGGGGSQKFSGKHEQVMTTRPHWVCPVSFPMVKGKDQQSSPRWLFISRCIIPPGSESCWPLYGKALTTCAANPPVNTKSELGNRRIPQSYSSRDVLIWSSRGRVWSRRLSLDRNWIFYPDQGSDIYFITNISISDGYISSLSFRVCVSWTDCDILSS